MASSIALLKKASTAANLSNKFIHPVHFVSVAPSSHLRSFTGSSSAEVLNDYSDDGVELEIVEHPRRSDESLGRRGYYGPNLYSGGGGDYVLDPFCSSQILDVMDYGRNPFVVADYPRGEKVLRRGWDVVEDDEAMYLKVDMPGLGKEHVKVSVEKTTLVIKGEEGEKEVDGDKKGGRRCYSRMIDLPVDVFKICDISAEMKNGVLTVSLPKVKEDEKKKKKDVVEVTVQ